MITAALKMLARFMVILLYCVFRWLFIYSYYFQNLLQVIMQVVLLTKFKGLYVDVLNKF